MPTHGNHYVIRAHTYIPVFFNEKPFEKRRTIRIKFDAAWGEVGEAATKILASSPSYEYVAIYQLPTNTRYKQKLIAEAGTRDLPMSRRSASNELPKPKRITVSEEPLDLGLEGNLLLGEILTALASTPFKLRVFELSLQGVGAAQIAELLGETKRTETGGVCSGRVRKALFDVQQLVLRLMPSLKDVQRYERGLSDERRYITSEYCETLGSYLDAAA